MREYSQKEEAFCLTWKGSKKNAQRCLENNLFCYHGLNSNHLFLLKLMETPLIRSSTPPQEKKNAVEFNVEKISHSIILYFMKTYSPDIIKLMKKN